MRSEPLEATRPRSNSALDFLARVYFVAAAYYRSAERRWAFIVLGVVIVFTLGTVAISAGITYWYKGFYDALQSYDAALIWHEVGVFAALASAWVLVNVLLEYCTQVFQNRWRRWMTATYVHRWMTRHTYYRMQIGGSRVDNPDQRIAEDLEFFTAQSLLLPLGLIRSVVSIVVFGIVLWNLSEPIKVFGEHVPGYLVWVNVGYALVGTLIVIWIGKPLFWLNNIYQKAQGDFRYNLVRVRENSESIASSRGHGASARQLIERFQPVFDIFHRRIRRNIGVNGFSFSFNQAAVLIPVVAVLPAYLDKEIKLGVIMAVLSAFGQVQQAFAYLIDNFTSNGSGHQSLTQWVAVTDRLYDMKVASQQYRPKPNDIHVRLNSSGHLQTRGLSLSLPEGDRTLLSRADLDIGPGERILITGRTGVGKSTLLRAFVGIWPYGGGEILIPDSSRCFIPQRAYLPEGRLSDAIAYPRRQVDRDELDHWLEICRLSYLRPRVEEFGAWDKRLSLGELQRLAFVRLFLTRAQWNLLDEVTSSLDEELESLLYEQLIATLPDSTIISIAHRSTLRRFHQKELHLTTDGLVKTRKLVSGADLEVM